MASNALAAGCPTLQSVWFVFVLKKCCWSSKNPFSRLKKKETFSFFTTTEQCKAVYEMEPEFRRRRGKLCVRTLSPSTPLKRSLACSRALAHNFIPSASGERRPSSGSAAQARQHGSQVRALVCAESCVMLDWCVRAHAPCALFPDGGALPSSLFLSLALSAQTRDKEREGEDSDGGARTPCNRARELQCRTYRIVTGA